MLRSSDSFASSLLRGHRPYQLAIVLLCVLFGWYVVSTERRLSMTDEPERRLYPAQLPSLVAAAPCNCDCHCSSTEPSATERRKNHATLAPLASAANAVALSGEWKPVTQTQSYGSLPAIVDGSHMQYVRATYPPVGPEKGSILDASYLNTPIGYGTHHVPLVSGDAFPSGFIPRPACQRDSDILQTHIYTNQHPADCRTAKLFVRRHMPGYGLFAGLGLSSNYLFLASVLGRTLVDLSPNTYFTGNCAGGGLECAFLPISSCGPDAFDDAEVCYDASCWSSARVVSIDRSSLSDFLPCAPTEYPKSRCNQNGGPPITRTLHEALPELKAHGEQFFQGEFSRYLTRPNAKLAQYAADTMKELGLTDQTIAVHVRHGDKQEGIQFPTRAYSLIVRRVVQITGIKTVFIGSDDKSVYEELPKWVGLEGVTYKWMNPELNPIVFSAAEAGRQGANTIGLNLMAQTIIFTQSQAYIGTRSSNAGQIVYAMQGNDCGRQKIAYDMYGDLFYNSWYCRGDIEHAGREWMCAITKPTQGLIWEWGGSKTQC